MLASHGSNQEGGLQARQILAMAAAKADAGPVLAEDPQANAEAVAAPERGFDPLRQLRAAVQVGR